MLINRRFDYQPIERVTQENGVRHYMCPETQSFLPSITTILSATGNRSGLDKWKAWVGLEQAEKIKREASGLGSLMHEHIEKHILNEDRPRGTNKVRKMAEAMANEIIKHGLRNVDEVWGQEIGLYYPGLFAGTTDLVGIYRGKEAIIDHKTTRKMKKRNQIGDYFDQISSYALCHNHVYGTNIQTGVIFMVDRVTNYQEFIIEKDELERHQCIFLNRVGEYLEKYSS